MSPSRTPGSGECSHRSGQHWPSGSKTRFTLQVSSPLNIWLFLGEALLAEAASEWGLGMETMFYSWALFLEPLGNTCEEGTWSGDVAHCRRNRASPSFFCGLHTGRGPEFLSLREGVSLRPWPGPPSLLLGSEGKPFFLLFEASKATGRCHHRGSRSLPRLARTAA